MRTQCPFCLTDDPEKTELVFVEDRKPERAELCHACRKYVVSVDLRELALDLPHEVAALGMVHLDWLAQQRGFTPGAVCAWNVIGD
jgi:FdhE protein